MNNYLDLANELDRARSEHLNSFGSSPVVVRKARRKLLQLLWDDKFTIIEALRLAASNGQRTGT